ncbi:MAG: hypothetical protein M1819_003211 [Sarea resinae]|nr:MAG: hypothetical protein M1819_003211 [Sarea resinae]
MEPPNGFHTFENGHQDLVLAVDYNLDGTRLVTASSDHRLKVRDVQGDEWKLVDTWRAHDAEVIDVKWNGPYMGQVLGSVGEDGKLKLWEEDTTEPPNSGRRFKCIYSHTSPSHIPYVSLDMKNIQLETWIALLSRDGLLSIYEPSDPDSLANWQLFDQLQVCSLPARGEETSFKVCFHHDALPCYTAVMAGLDKKALSLVVGGMDSARVYRTNKRNQLYAAAELTGHHGLVRDVDWARGSVRGYDLIATASKDGFVRIFEVRTPFTSEKEPTSEQYMSVPNSETKSSGAAQSRGSRNPPSGIGAGLAGAMKANGASRDGEGDGHHVKHVVKEVAALAAHRAGVWRVRFNRQGDVLCSAGDDGRLRLWKRAITGEWLEFAEIGADDSRASRFRGGFTSNP